MNPSPDNFGQGNESEPFVDTNYVNSTDWNVLDIPGDNFYSSHEQEHSSRSRTSESYVLVNDSGDPSIVNNSSGNSRYLGSTGSGDVRVPLWVA